MAAVGNQNGIGAKFRLPKLSNLILAGVQVQQRLTTILDHWGGRVVFEEDFIEELKWAMVEGPRQIQQQPVGYFMGLSGCQAVISNPELQPPLNC